MLYLNFWKTMPKKVLALVISANLSLFALPEGFQIGLVAQGLDPVMMDMAPDGRIFIANKPGQIMIVENDVLLEAPFVDISGKTISSQERGLLGVAVDPDFIKTPYIYAWYNDVDDHAYVVRWLADGNSANLESEEMVFDLQNFGEGGYHHGGDVAFGPDGKLYITRGNGHTVSNSSDKTSIFGTILRVNKDGSIPEDNPFYDENEGDARAIWIWGVRNSFNLTWQPGTNLMYFNDVMDNNRDDEINEGIAGEGYGYDGGGSVEPLYTWGSTGNALMGGVFYNKKRESHELQFPEEYLGLYFFGNNGGSQDIRTLNPQGHEVLDFENGYCVVDFVIDPLGSLYGTDRCEGGIIKITYPEAMGEFTMGCTDSTASNYNGNANLDDGSCDFENSASVAFPGKGQKLQYSRGILSFPGIKSGNYKLQIHNIQGQMAYENNLSLANNYGIKLGLKPGLYNLKISGNAVFAVQKFLVK